MNKTKTIPAKKIKSETAPGERIMSLKSAGIFTVIFAVAAITITSFHEMWRDEFQAWQITTASSSLSELYSNIRYEGHPIIWYLLLFIASKFSDNAVAMQVVHVTIAIVTAFLVFRFAPFKTTEKILLLSGYFFLYEYCVISRNYALSVLLIVWLCVLFQQKKFPGIIEGILLLLLCNTSLYGAFIAAAFSVYILMRMKNGTDRGDSKKMVIPLFFAAIGFLLLYLQISPASEMEYNDYYKWDGGFSFSHLTETIAKLFDVYFPVPSMQVSDSFGKNIITGIPFVKAAIALGVVVLICLSLKKNKNLLVTFSLTTIGILSVLYFNNHTSLRHDGFLFILLVVVMWLSENSNLSEEKSFGPGKKIFFAILVLQSLGGVLAAGKEIAYPFSNLEDAGAFAIKNGYDQCDICGIPDYIVSPLSAFTHQPVYAMESGRKINFITWDDERNENTAALTPMFLRADSLVKHGLPKAIIVLNVGLVDSLNRFIQTMPINDTNKLTLAKRFDKPSLIANEKYYFYEVTRK